MGVNLHITAVLTAACLSAACGSTQQNPAAPSPAPGAAPPSQVVSLAPVWGITASVDYREAATLESVNLVNCNGNWLVDSQNAGDFSGHASLNGSGVDSDKVCTGSFEFTGRVTPDGAVAVQPTRSSFFSNRCSNLSNGGAMNGAVNPDNTITLRSVAEGTCLDRADRPRQVVRTVTFNLWRR